MSSIIFYLIGFMLLFAPIFRASNLPLPLLVLQLSSLVLLLLLYLNGKSIRHQKILWLIFALALLSLMPLPIGLWASLPGRADYMPLFNWIQSDQNWHSLSLISQVSEYALWTLMVPLLVYAAASTLQKKQLLKLIYLILIVASLEAMLGLMQFGQGQGSPLYFGSPYQSNATGTYYNADHFAGLLEMILPIVIGLLAARIGYRARQHRLNFWQSLHAYQALIYATVAVLLVLAILFSRSRMAIALLMLGLLLSGLFFFRRLGGDNRFGLYGSIIALAFIFALEIGIMPVLNRFSEDISSNLRWTIYETSWQGVGDFAPIGSGTGTYPFVYPKYQPIEISHFVNRAHNDYLEWLFDQGPLVLILIAYLLWLYFKQWRALLIKGRWGLFRFVQIGAGIGLFLIILHSIVDFNLHKPANALYFAFLAAVFMQPNDEEKKRRKPVIDRRKKTKTALPAHIEKTQEDEEFLSNW